MIKESIKAGMVIANIILAYHCYCFLLLLYMVHEKNKQTDGRYLELRIVDRNRDKQTDKRERGERVGVGMKLMHPSHLMSCFTCDRLTRQLKETAASQMETLLPAEGGTSHATGSDAQTIHNLENQLSMALQVGFGIAVGHHWHQHTL